MTITTASPAAAALETVYAPPGPVDLMSTLGQLRRGPGDPAMRLEADGSVWLALRTAAGTATLCFRAGRDRIHVRAWGSGASEALHGVPDLLGAGDDWGDLDLHAAGPGAVAELLASSLHHNPGLRLTRTGRVLDALVPAVIEQRVTSVEAFRAWRILVAAHGEKAPGPAPRELRVPPTALIWRRIPSWEWHRAGVDPRRSMTAVGAAAAASGLERTTADGCPPAEARRRLMTLMGVGVWTAAETAQRSHGDPDAVSFGDYHLASFMGLALVGEAVDDDALAELLEPWAGQRQRIVRLVLASGFRVARHGARITIQDHRRH
jgi:3-methyladenine DNA glycosylase/8-oxoguanine DNA glycosylase